MTLFKSIKILALPLILVSSIVDAEVQVVPKTGFDHDSIEIEKAAPDSLRAHFIQAVREYRQILRLKHWPDAEVTGRNRLVFYNQDYSQKQAIDFQANEIQVTMPTLKQGDIPNYKQMEEMLRNTLQDILSKNLKTAIANDPITQHLEEFAGIRYANDLGTTGNDLILGELFRNERPSIQAIQTLTSKLIKKAYIRYPVVASLENTLALASNNRTTYIVPLPEYRIRIKAKRYKAYVDEAANQFDLPSSLIFAIIHAESHFNPVARSQGPAFGLMQVIPHTSDESRSMPLLNHEDLESFSYLYHPKQNIQAGTAYLHTLYAQNLSDIQDPKIRMYCTIAAYNSGLDNIFRTLADTEDAYDAIALINQLSKKEVLRKLMQQTPTLESREYLNKVLSLQKTYAHL